MSWCENLCNSELRYFFLSGHALYTMMQMYSGGYLLSVCLYACLHGQKNIYFSLSAFLFSSSPLISVLLVAPQNCPLWTAPNKTTNKPFCILIKTIRIFWLDSQRYSQFSTILSCGGFIFSVLKTLIHKDINQSAFVNTGSLCSHVINPLMVIGIERNVNSKYGNKDTWSSSSKDQIWSEVSEAQPSFSSK